MWFGVLGPLCVEPGGPPIRIAAARQRVLLAALAVRPGQVVSFEELTEAVWDDEPPPGARATLRNYVKRLRQALGPAGARIITRAPGYLLDAAADEVDLLSFARLCRRGGTALRAGDWPEASDLLDQALGLWRGAPLADVASRTLRDEHVPVLESLRLQAAEWRLEAGLRLGRDGQLLPELQALVHSHPLHERFRAQLMLALYRSGQQAEALAAYQDIRAALVSELCVEPGPDLRDLQRRILAADPALLATPTTASTTTASTATASTAKAGPAKAGPAKAGPAKAGPAEAGPAEASTVKGSTVKGSTAKAGAANGSNAAGDRFVAGQRGGRSRWLAGPPNFAGPAPGGPAPGLAQPALGGGVPRQLPAAGAHFAGRAAELAALGAWLDQATAGQPGGAVLIAAISGLPGVGKTALALRWAHQVAARFPDGQLYVNLRGYDPSGRPAKPGRVIRRFLAALGLAPPHLPPDLDGQAVLYRSALAGRRLLILADNAWDAVQVRPLLPAAPGTLVLVTSRGPLAGLAAADGARLLSLDVPSVAEARQLLAARLGAARLAAEPAAVTELISRCGRLPLALASTAARTSASGGSLAALAAELAAGDELGVLGLGDTATDVRDVLSWSYARLSGPAARLFRLLGRLGGPELPVAAAASLAAMPPARVGVLLRELAGVGLITEQAPGRYRTHVLLRAYAAELAQASDPAAGPQTPPHRMPDHHLEIGPPTARVIGPARRTGPTAQALLEDQAG